MVASRAEASEKPDHERGGGHRDPVLSVGVGVEPLREASNRTARHLAHTRSVERADVAVMEAIGQACLQKPVFLSERCGVARGLAEGVEVDGPEVQLSTSETKGRHDANGDPDNIGIPPIDLTVRGGFVVAVERVRDDIDQGVRVNLEIAARDFKPVVIDHGLRVANHLVDRHLTH